MEEKNQCLQYKTKANDVDEKGVVTVAVNGIGVKDSQNDISMPGSFNKTLKENIGRMKWFLNHDVTQLLGVPLSGKEEDGNLVMVGQLNLEKQIGRDILSDYKLYAENGRTLEHSIGVRAIKRDSADPRKVLEWKMMEYSTLTGWGSNPQTFLVGIKSATPTQVRSAIEFLQKAAKESGYSDERLKTIDMELNLLLKSINGGHIVTCPCCGTQFDYDEQQEVTFSQQVLDLAANYTRWMTEDIVSEEIGKLEGEVRNQVTSILDAVKAENGEITEKGIQEMMEYVRCPHCWSRVYKTNAIIQNNDGEETKSDEPSQDTQKNEDPEPQKKAADSTSFFGQLNGMFDNQ